MVVGKRESGNWIVVTGQRQIGGDFANFYGEMYNGGSGSEPAVPPDEPPDCSITDIIDEYGGPSSYDDQVTLAETVDKILDKLGNLAGGGSFSHLNSSVSTSELYGNLRNMDFEIKPDWWTPDNGGIGEVLYNGGDPLARIRAEGLEGYAANGQTGMVFYVLHELVHATAAGNLRNNNTEDGNDEVWVNDLVRLIANEIGLALDPSFVPGGGGYSSTNPTFQAGTGAPVETTSGCGS